MKVRSKTEMWKDSERLTRTLVAAEQVNYGAEAVLLRDSR